MATPYLGEIKLCAFQFAPRGWALCQGQLLPINQNQALFSLLGTTYGGDGRVNFALPDLRGRTPIHAGSNGMGNHVLGERGGEESHTLTIAELPPHTHAAQGTGATPATAEPGDALLAPSGGGRRPLTPYGTLSAPVALSPQGLASAGVSQPHPTMQPSLPLNFCIALQGIFPSQS
jgi:microcystin-dependent protein